MKTNSANPLLNILLVDDTADISRLISQLIREVPGVGTIDCVENLNKAYACISSKKPDVVLLDIHLKNESGFELLGFLNEKHPEIKVVMVTNLSQSAYRQKSKEMGAHYFIDKSKEFEKLPGILISLAKNNLQKVYKEKTE